MRTVSFDVVKMPPARRDPTANAAIAEVMAERKRISTREGTATMECAERPRNTHGRLRKRPACDSSVRSCLNCDFYCYWDAQGTELGCKNWLRPNYRQHPSENTCKCWRLASDISAKHDAAKEKSVWGSNVYAPSASAEPASESRKTP